MAIDRLAVDWMLHVDGPMAQRISRGAAIAKAGGVERTAQPFLFLVYSQSEADRCYRVDHGVCDCPDAARNSARECKHCWSVRLAIQVERRDADRHVPMITITVEPEDEAIPYELMPRTTPRCQHCGTPAPWRCRDGWCPDCCTGARGFHGDACARPRPALRLVAVDGAARQ